jgi:hypothetical protein
MTGLSQVCNRDIRLALSYPNVLPAAIIKDWRTHKTFKKKITVLKIRLLHRVVRKSCNTQKVH